MFSTIQLSIALPSYVSEDIGLNSENQVRFIQKMSEPVSLPLDSASPRFLVYKDPCQFDTFYSLFGLSTNSSEKETNKENELNMDSEEEKEVTMYLSTLDPRLWKDQDHYLVLGLHDLRYKATQEDIKNAYLKKALKHHPDKKASQKNTTTSPSTSFSSFFPPTNKFNTQDNEKIFKCLQKANDILSDPVKRQDYDSIDPGIDDTLPSLIQLQTWVDNQSWYDKVNALLEKEMRFAIYPEKITSVGDANSTKLHVDTFYEAWYHFESWRRFDYLDRDEREGENRDDKRYQDKKNKAERMKKLTLEKARLRTLIELIEQTDPRIKVLKEKEKEMKKLMKQAKLQKYATATVSTPTTIGTTTTTSNNQKANFSAPLTTTSHLSQQSAMDSSIKLKEAKELEKQSKVDMKKEKKTLKQWVTKQARYFVPENKELTSQQMEKVLMDLDQVLEKKCTSLSLIQGLKHVLLQSHAEGGIAQSKHVFELIVKGEQEIVPTTLPANSLLAQTPEETNNHTTTTDVDQGSFSTFTKTSVSSTVESTESVPSLLVPKNSSLHTNTSSAAALPPSSVWSSKELGLLIKATNLFPGGTQRRWEKIVEYIAEHGHEPKRSIAEVIQQTKLLNPNHPSMTPTSLHSTIQHLQDETNEKSLEKKKNKILDHPHHQADVPTSLRDVDSSSSSLTQSHPKEEKDTLTKSENTPPHLLWTQQQQSQLQMALKTYPTSTYKSMDRFDKIAAMVDGKDKLACIARCKYLVEQSKLKTQSTSNSK
ncbi:DnaJ (Hsp40), sub C, member 2 [Coelomomyces lativittatus]|nr:DnaJ (Hsp40), sub C, member 2 [Coelomomyces lativittatus]KAJ1505095.1 DnaJ (Hsp40), sub C, member 2 [Coelomomyces lativittatus]KAJ1505264.1 DnaJ (Hsp40), sub C, member 2 [Coelomomyces lativittatus]